MNWKLNLAWAILIFGGTGLLVNAQTPKKTKSAVKSKTAATKQIVSKRKTANNKTAPTAKTENAPALEMLISPPAAPVAKPKPAATTAAKSVNQPALENAQPAPPAAAPEKTTITAEKPKIAAAVGAFVKDKPEPAPPVKSLVINKTEPPKPKPETPAAKSNTTNAVVVSTQKPAEKPAAKEATTANKPVAKEILPPKTVVQPAVAPKEIPPVITSAVLVEINALRRNPQSFVPYLEAWRTKENINSTKNAAIVAAIDEAVVYLKQAKSVNTLRQAKGLDLAALAHLFDIRQTGKFEHNGSDGSTPTERIARFGDVTGSASQIIGQGDLTPREIVMQLIVDNNDSQHKNRQRLLDGKFKMAGAVSGESTKFGGLSVIVMTENFVERY